MFKWESFLGCKPGSIFANQSVWCPALVKERIRINMVLSIDRVPGWLSRLSVWLRLKSWSHGLWVQAPHRALYWQFRAWNLLLILCLPLSLFPSPDCAPCLSLSLSLKNKLTLKKRTNMVLSIDAEKAFDKIQHPINAFVTLCSLGDI